ncbi:hypothetical protein EDC04DRAFT_2775695, partial [Pisolithus marmoratus]
RQSSGNRPAVGGCCDTWFLVLTEFLCSLKDHGAVKEVQAMFDLGAETFALPLEEKLKYEQGDPGRLPDMVESLNIAKDDVLAFPDVVHRTYPSTVSPVIPSVVRPFVCKSLEVNNIILRIFTQRLGLPEGTLEELHRGLPSDSKTRVTRSPPIPGRDSANRPISGAHTDFGSVAFLHNILGGVQVLLPEEMQWRYVKPIRGHAICNIGDALAVFSGGIPKSSVHHVVPPPGAQGEHECRSVVFHNRSNGAQALHALVEHSPAIAESVKQYPKGKFETGSTVAEWYLRRIKYQRLGNRTGPQSWAASRGTEHDPAAK